MFKGIIATTILFTAVNSLGNTKTICGANDDRILSNDPTIGRISIEGKHKGCTATLISNSCAITAGHCEHILERAEFNTPSSYDSEPQPSELEDVYAIDKNSIKFANNGAGDDWAVFKFLPNTISRKLPGAVQGFRRVSFSKLKKNSIVRVTGYGYDPDDFFGNFSQQTHTGKVVSAGGVFYGSTTLKHTVDTMGGNSGSTITLENSGLIVGIHTHGGCRSTYGENLGTVIYKHQELKMAIQKCIQSDH